MTQTSRKQSGFFKGAFLGGAVAAIAVMSASPAFAGFEWRGAPPAAAVAAPVMAAPANGAGPAVMAAPVDAVAAAPVGAPSGIVWGDDKNAAVPLVPADKMKASEETVSGFGADLPLSVALKQVVPASYKTVLAKGVKGDAHVSWSGDKPWRDVLTQMLSSQGLSYAVDGNTVTVNAGPASKKTAAAAKADLIPDDMISANEKKAAPATDTVMGIDWAPHAKTQSAPETVTIRREKPSSLIDKMTSSKTKTPASAEDSSAHMLAEKTIEPVSDAQPLRDITATRETAPHLSAQADQQAAPAVVEPSWRATKGETLHTILDDWSKAAHVDLYWSTDYDYRLNDTVAYGGNYGDAVGKLLDRFNGVRPQPYGRLHRNAEGNMVLVVNTYDTSN